MIKSTQIHSQERIDSRKKRFFFLKLVENESAHLRSETPANTFKGNEENWLNQYHRSKKNPFVDRTAARLLPKSNELKNCFDTVYRLHKLGQK